MRYSFNKTLAALMLVTSVSGAIPASLADVTDTLPDIGTTAGATLSINQELQIGDFYVRELRGSSPLINDPLLTGYINSIGQRLVAHAWSVKTPFHFYLIQNDELNAFAFFGGNVVLHSAIFRYTDNESQLASVMAHEISHVTQRHLARAMEAQKRSAPLTWVGALGSILLAIANPEAGMAALTGTLAGTQQGMISFTQENEKEADRIGIQVLQRSGFDPQAMPAFLQKLADQTRYASKPPEILLTHPLPDSRLADARDRANQMPRVVVHSSQDFFLPKFVSWECTELLSSRTATACWMTYWHNMPGVMSVSNWRQNTVKRYSSLRQRNSRMRKISSSHCYKASRLIRGFWIS